MLIWRRLHDDAEMPKPIRMNGRRFWYLSKIIAYERKLVERTVDAA
jgi:predicted DNA-binding transcriptional regulator AlpA